MAQDNVFKRYLEAGAAFTQLTQQRAEAIARDLVKAGEVQTEQAQVVATELIERSRKNTERLVSQVRREVRDQVSNLGLATKADIARIERQIASLKGSPVSKTPTSEKRAAKKSPAKKAAVKKAPVKKSPGKKAAVKKASVKKAPGKKAAGKKAARR